MIDIMSQRGIAMDNFEIDSISDSIPWASTGADMVPSMIWVQQVALDSCTR